MRMTDLSLLEFNTVPGAMAEDAGRGVQLWPPLQEMVDRWRQN